MLEAIKTLQQAIVHFSDPENCRKFMVFVRWPDGTVRCPYRCVEWGRTQVGARNYHMVFDGDEPAKSILWDIHNNSGALDEYPFLKDWEITKGNMRLRPGLQMADLFAFSHANRAQYNGERWHQMVMGIEQDCYYFSYEDLIDPHLPAIEKRDLWKLNKRSRTR